jgi:hypothetical protein
LRKPACAKAPHSYRWPLNQCCCWQILSVFVYVYMCVYTCVRDLKGGRPFADVSIHTQHLFLHIRTTIDGRQTGGAGGELWLACMAIGAPHHFSCVL